VIIIYGKQRCPTCLAIEKNTKELLQTSFANELKDGSVVFRQIDISLDENEQIADKYECHGHL
jgi:disulfide oxidoreductase YuzD